MDFEKLERKENLVLHIGPGGYYLVPFCGHIILGFETYFYTTQTEGNVMYLAIYLQKHTLQLRSIII